MKRPSPQRAFTLLELLVVISIIGVVAALSVPAIKSFGKANAIAAASRQMLDDVQRARQLAISQRTVVYMLFVPPGFWSQPAINASIYANLPGPEQVKARLLFDKQLLAYTFVAMRTVGDQPGRSVPRYLSPWRTLPPGAFIAAWKFAPRAVLAARFADPVTGLPFFVPGFSTTNIVPFPSEFAPRASASNPYLTLPYIAFDATGQLLSGQDEFIPLAAGSVLFARDPTKHALAQAPAVEETPSGNSTNAFNLVHIDWLTGRARVETPPLR